MNIVELLADMQGSPEKYIFPVDCMALGAYLHGYRMANPVHFTAYQILSNELQGSDNTCAATAMYLREPSDVKGVALLVHGLQQLLQDPENRVPPTDCHVDDAWAPSILDGIRQGRPAMYLGESNVFWLNNYVNGFLAGLRARNPVAAEEQERELADFERYLQRYFKKPGIQWYKLLRIYGGVYINGLNKFAKMWDEWKASCQSPGVEGLADNEIDTSDE